jgi:hypothetical protein
MARCTKNACMPTLIRNYFLARRRGSDKFLSSAADFKMFGQIRVQREKTLL